MLATSFNELPSRDTLLSLSGLDFMRGILDGSLSGPPIAGIMGYALETVEAGRVVFTGTPGFAHTNPMGGVHGGWYGTLLDSAMACAVMTTLPQGSIYTTLEYKINITRAIPPGTAIRAEGRVDHAGRSTGVATGRIVDVDGRLYATGSTTCLIMKIA
ncbi:PaaI family thioesterase [Loktanella sp. SALINAS62]|uniref:PaaI family thioesterase n=1 Tax=Loktanella sp. SALINAS62 TaxID=2706124 RepID=UPI001B8C6A93|nr:PaaI family thioesterase [Loktanella sp. SALINAS62]MBS1300784.1 PaaI family thioesterase [Loktanella sp. SALINAS62]